MAIIFFTIFFFFYLYVPELIILPISPRVMMSMIGIMIYSFSIIKRYIKEKEDFTFNKNYLSFWILVFSLLIFSILSVVINQSSDIITIRDVIVRFTVLFGGAFFLIKFGLRFLKNLQIKTILNIYISIISIQCLIAILTFINPSIKLAFDSIQKPNDFAITQNIGLARMGGFGMTFFGAGTDCGLALITIAAIIRNSNLSFIKTLLYAVLFLFIVSVGNFMSRTTLVGLLISIVYLIIPGVTSKSNYRFLYILIGFLFIIIIYAVPILLNSEKYAVVFRFAFEGFFNFIDYGKFETNSSNELQGMFNWPTNLSTYIIGDGYFSNPIYSWKYYMDTDVGYLRLLYYGGFIYLLIWFFFHIFLLQKTYLNFKINWMKLYFIFIFIFLLIINAKGLADFFPFAVTLFVFSIEKTKKYSVSINPTEQKI